MTTINDLRLKLDEFNAECLMPIKEFRDSVASHCIMDYDGSGEYVNDNAEFVGSVDFSVREINKKIKQGINFVCWYNK